MSVQKNDIVNFIQRNNLEDSIICLHSSLKSFGFIEGGANAVLDAFLECGCTLVCPAFYWKGFLPPQKKYTQNGMDYESTQNASVDVVFESVNYEEKPEQIDVSMGAIPRTLLTYPQAIRTENPMNSFCVAGQLADKLVNGQTANIVDSVYTAYTVYKNIFMEKNAKAFILLAGVDFTSCTPIHFAEEISGKKQFRRWGLYKSVIAETELGSCSEGFENLRPYMMNLEKTDTVGNSTMRYYPFNEFILQASQVIKENTTLTMCSPNCTRCVGMSRGGFKE